VTKQEIEDHLGHGHSHGVNEGSGSKKKEKKKRLLNEVEII
jgi:hypothetical protein